MNDVICDENFMIYCARYYDNRHCLDVEEFLEDLGRIKYIKKLITRYQTTGELKERLILNHITILSNVFPPPHLVRILYLRAEAQMEVIKPFLLLLNILPQKFSIGNPEKIIDTDMIKMDRTVVDSLRKI